MINGTSIRRCNVAQRLAKPFLSRLQEEGLWRHVIVRELSLMNGCGKLLQDLPRDLTTAQCTLAPGTDGDD